MTTAQFIAKIVGTVLTSLVLLVVGIVLVATVPPLWIAFACGSVAYWRWSNERDRIKRERQKFDNVVLAKLGRRRP